MIFSLAYIVRIEEFLRVIVVDCAWKKRVLCFFIFIKIVKSLVIVEGWGKGCLMGQLKRRI